MRPLILFSGGLDSTTLVYDHLCRGEDVDVLYIDCGQGDKIKVEKEQASKILNLFTDMYEKEELQGRIIMRYMDATFTWSEGGVPRRFSFAQVLPWLVTAMQYAREGTHDGVEIAYCMGDQISSELYRLQEVWSTLWGCVMSVPVVPLKFPFIRESKNYFLKRLPSYIRDLTWVCEIPKDLHEEGDEETMQGPRWEACGECAACRRSKMEQSVFPTLRQDERPGPTSQKPPREDEKEKAPTIDIIAQDVCQVEDTACDVLVDS